MVPRTDKRTDNRTDIEAIRDDILRQALPEVAFEGWTPAVLGRAAERAGHDPAMVRAVFPDGVADALSHFADYIDRLMMERLAGVSPEGLRVRDRIRVAVLARLEVLAPYREAERAALTWWSLPLRHLRGGRVVWRTADRIWVWAGDTASDYNHYTKRGLLSGVLGTTVLAWLSDEGQDQAALEAFLDRRIENVMQIGRVFGRIRKTA